MQDTKLCKICKIEKPKIECVTYQKICKPCKSDINRTLYVARKVVIPKPIVKEEIKVKRPVGRPKKVKEFNINVNTE